MIRFLALFTAVILTFAATVSAKVLTEISLEGVEQGGERAVLAIVPLTIGEEYSFEDVGRTIRQLYKTNRFRNVSIFTINETETTTGIRIAVEMNEYCDGIEYTGNDKLTNTKIRELITIKRGELLTDARVHENIIAIREAYHEKGYLQVSVECELVPTQVPGYVISRFVIRERDKIRVEQINFSGNVAYSTNKLGRTFKIKRRKVFSSGEFIEADYEANLDTLMQEYKNDGFLEAQIISDSVYLNTDSTGLIIDIEIDEGEQFLVGDVYFRNNSVISSYTLSRAITLRKGKPFSAIEFQQTQAMVGNVYRNEGYLWSQLTPSYRYRADSVDVIFDIVEGNPAIVRKIDITGNDKTREQVIRRELTIYPGQKYSQSLMERSIREVRQLNYFDNVVPDIAPNNDGSIDLIFDVVEKENIGQFSAGVTFSQQEKFGGNFSISIPNFRGAGEQLDAMAEIAKGRQRYSLGFTEPWIFNTPVRFNARAFYEKVDHLTNSLYSYERIGTEFGFGKKLSWPDDYFYGNARYLISYDWNQNSYGSIEEQIGVDIITQGLQSRLYLGITRNDTDYPQFPTRGSVFSVGSYFGGLGGEYNYVKGTVSYNWYHRLASKFVLGAKTKFGMIGSFDGDTRIGYNDLFQVGGVYYDGIVRGYGEATLGIDLMMMTLSAELRFPIIDQQFYIGGFFDMGNSYNTLEEIDIASMYSGVGAGVRLMLPMVGLLGFDFGLPLPNLGDNDVSSLNLDPEHSKKPKFYFIMNRGF